MRIIFTIFLLVFASCIQKSFSQKKTSGILILSLTRDHTSFDLFVPGNIDTKLCLKENLNRISDTAIRFGIYEEGLLKPKMLFLADTIINEAISQPSEVDDIRTVLVLAVEVEYEPDSKEILLPDEFYSFDVIFFNKLLITTYNNNKPFFKKLRILKLPKKGCG